MNDDRCDTTKLRFWLGTGKAWRDDDVAPLLDELDRIRALPSEGWEQAAWVHSSGSTLPLHIPPRHSNGWVLCYRRVDGAAPPLPDDGPKCEVCGRVKVLQPPAYWYCPNEGTVTHIRMASGDGAAPPEPEPLFSPKNVRLGPASSTPTPEPSMEPIEVCRRALDDWQAQLMTDDELIAAFRAALSGQQDTTTEAHDETP